jgi:hypothetical protein
MSETNHPPTTTTAKIDQGSQPTSNPGTTILILIAVLLPPLAVSFKRGCSGTLAVNILLTLIG